MDTHKLFNGLLMLALLLPTLLTDNPIPTQAAEPLNALNVNQRLQTRRFIDETVDGPTWRPHPEPGVDEPGRTLGGDPANDLSTPPSDLSEFSGTAVQSSSHTWDTDADFTGIFDLTEVVSGTDQVTLLRRWTANVKANDDSGSDLQSSPSLAVDGNGNLYATWHDRRNGNRDIYFAKSTDGGATWNTNVQVNDGSSREAYNPSLVVDGGGNPYIAWGDSYYNFGIPFPDYDYDIYFAKSTDGGTAWSTNIQVNGNRGTFPCNPSLAVDGSGNLYTAWKESPYEVESSNIYFARSIDGGATWSADILVNDATSPEDQYGSPSLAMDRSGNLYISWTGYRNENPDIYFARSTDGGVTWSTNIQVNDDTGWLDEQNYPSLAVDSNGNLYVAWMDYRNGHSDIYSARSTDGGTAWSADVQINDDTGSDSQRNPSLAVDDSSNLYVSWTDYRNGNSDIYFARSTNGGAIWSANAQVNDDTGSAVQYTSPSLTVDGSGDLYVAWQDERNGNNDIYTSRWPDDTHFHTTGSYAYIHDASTLSTWNSLAWTSALPSGTAITLTVRASHSARWSDWYTFTTSPVDLSGLPPARYVQWKAWLSSPISTTTPALESVTVSWDSFTYTEVGGFISSDTTWTAADSPYLVTENVLVSEGVVLTVEPGVTVLFSDTRALQVLGTLVAIGNVTQPITFTSWHVSPQPGDWGAISFGDTAVDAIFDEDGNYLSGSVLQYASVEYAGWESFDHAVDAPDTAVYVDYCTIHHNGGGGLQMGSDGNYITHNTISDNNGNGIYSTGPYATISGNTVTDNSDSGIYNAYSLLVTISSNTISGNRYTGIYNSGPYATISGNTISGNRSTVSREGCINWSWGGSGEIVYNTIVSNTSTGSTGGIYVYSGYPTIHHNAIEDNDGYALYNNNDFSSIRLDARYNWWGTADDAAIQDAIFDWWDDGSKGLVDYNPYFTERPNLKPAGVNLDGRAIGLVDTPYTFDASVYPAAAIIPITFTWQATE